MLQHNYKKAILTLIILLLQCSQSNIDKGYSALRLGDYAMAIDFFKNALEKRPENFDARLGYGKAILQKAVALNSDTTLWNYALIQLEAARTIQPTAELNGILSEAWVDRAQMAIDMHDTVSSLEALLRAMEFDANNINAINLAGIIYFDIGHEQQAQILFDQAIAIDSTHVVSLFNRGMTAWVANEKDDAHAFWYKALSYDSSNEEVLYWFARAEKDLRQNNE